MERLRVTENHQCSNFGRGRVGGAVQEAIVNEAILSIMAT